MKEQAKCEGLCQPKGNFDVDLTAKATASKVYFF
jgi:hypothetical protein